MSAATAAAIPRRSAAPEYDFVLMWITLVLLAFGLVMVYSASIDIAEASRRTGHNSAYFLIRQAMFIGLGIAAGFAAFQVPMREWQRAAPWLFIGGLGLLAIVLIPGVGRNVYGSQRWVALGLLNARGAGAMAAGVGLDLLRL